MDGLLVSRVLDNLLNNAVSYAPPGTCVVIEYGTEGNDVFFTVSDEGPGISAGILERLFEPFVTETRPILSDPAFTSAWGSLSASPWHAHTAATSPTPTETRVERPLPSRSRG